MEVFVNYDFKEYLSLVDLGRVNSSLEFLSRLPAEISDIHKGKVGEVEKRKITLTGPNAYERLQNGIARPGTISYRVVDIARG